MDNCCGSKFDPDPRRDSKCQKEKVQNKITKCSPGQPCVRSGKRKASSTADPTAISGSKRKLRSCKACTEHRIECPLEGNSIFQLPDLILDFPTKEIAR